MIFKSPKAKQFKDANSMIASILFTVPNFISLKD